jgi:uncharacterized protein (DUF1778 family)
MLSSIKKTERITARVSSETMDRLVEAAAFSGSTLNQFLVQAAIEKARKIIEQESLVKLSYKDAEVFFKTIETPPKANEKLKTSVKEYKTSGLYE